MAETEARARAAAGTDPLTWAFEATNPPLQTRAPDDFARLLGADPGDLVDLDFWTEAALFVDSGIDAVVFGPGHIEQAHAPDEYVELSQLQRARATFSKMLTRDR